MGQCERVVFFVHPRAHGRLPLRLLRARGAACNAACACAPAGCGPGPSERPVAAVEAQVTPEEQAHKLALIAQLTVHEIAGWRFGIEMEGRAVFPGELDALAERERELGVKR